MSEALTERLSRWSQRKAAARRGGALPVEPEAAPAPLRRADANRPPLHVPQQAALEAPAAPAGPGEAMATDEAIAALPPIEGLTFQSDFTGFMTKGIPEALKRAALRKLWTSDPVLANLDGLCDYNEDHHLTYTPITADQTSYKVGSGYFDAVEEKLAELDVAPSGHADAGSGEVSESRVAAKDSDASEATLSDSDAVGDEAPAAPRQVAAAEAGGAPIKRDDGPTETEKDALK